MLNKSAPIIDRYLQLWSIRFKHLRGDQSWYPAARRILFAALRALLIVRRRRFRESNPLRGVDITSEEALRAGSLARANGAKRSSNRYLCSDASLAEQWDAGWLAHARVRNEFPGGSDGGTEALTPLRANPTCQEYCDGRLAHANGGDRSQNPYAVSNYKLTHQWNAGWEAHDKIRNNTGQGAPPSWPFEALHSGGNESGIRLRTSLFYWGGLVAFITGIALVSRDVMAGGFLVLTLAPCLFLYPFIRFLFGGKGGVVPAITTIVVEEVLKHKTFEALNRRSRRK